jgi:hypothetical protein
MQRKQATNAHISGVRSGVPFQVAVAADFYMYALVMSKAEANIPAAD